MIDSKVSVDAGLSRLHELTGAANLDVLEAATARLSEFEEVVDECTRQTTEVVELRTVKGHGICLGLYKSEHTAISRMFLSAGSVLKKHYHGEREIMGVMSGRLTIIDEEGKESKIGQYETLEIAPCQPHTKVADEDTWLWVITMPASQEFPDGPR